MTFRALACIALIGCGGSSETWQAPRTSEPAPAVEAPSADKQDSARGAATEFLDALVADEEARVAAVAGPEVHGRGIRERFGVLESYELAKDEETFEGDVFITAKMIFPKNAVTFAFVLAKPEDKWVVVSFKMIEVLKATVTGRVMRRQGKTVHVQALGGWLPEHGAEGEVSREIDQALPILGGARLVVGHAKVVAQSDTAFELEIQEEKSKMTIDGRQVDHLAPGGRLAFIWSFKICERTKSGESGAPYTCVE